MTISKTDTAGINTDVWAPEAVLPLGRASQLSREILPTGSANAPISSTFVRHVHMASAFSNDSILEPNRPMILRHARIISPVPIKTLNSAHSISEAEQRHYAVARNTMHELASEIDGPVTKSAIDTALKVLEQLRFYEYSPPEISWHSGDAVVMLWSLGDTTTAITVTDGEIGYVIRRAKKRLKMDHSINFNRFNLLELAIRGK